ncbi:MAG: fasciclin domain-containing protein [Bacteroidaceae bacterium]|nr:fasciclin domain-containing protein [Bacteroidaceae bacterium]
MISKRNFAHIAILVFCTFIIVSCNDTIPEEALYTYKREMLREYLMNHREYSEFTKIMDRADHLDLLGVYGSFTCFAPNNDAMLKYYEKQGISGIDELSVQDCDSIARNSIVSGVLYTIGDLRSLNYLPEPNMMGRNLSVEPVTILYNTDSVTTYRINRSANLIYPLVTDTLENAVIHPVDNVVRWSNKTLPYIMQDNKEISIFNQCLDFTGIIQNIQNITDRSYDASYWRDEKNMEGYSGARWYWVPETRNYGYTCFAVPDKILREVYDIGTGTNAQGVSRALIDMYKYACEKYKEGNGSEWYGKPNVDTEKFCIADFGVPTNTRHPLYRLVAYHVMPRNASFERLYTNCTICHYDINPVEWYSTMDEDHMLKVEYVYSTNQFQGERTAETMYLNSMYDPDHPQLSMRGAIVSPTLPEGLEQQAVNGIYYYIDRLIDYGQETQDKVFNTRMRIDFLSIWPEVINNNFRSTVTWDENFGPDSREKNWIVPPGYLENVEWDSSCKFYYCSPRNWFGSYEGDEFYISGTGSYDITFRLPRVPAGTYQIRLYFALTDGGGLTQAYVDGMPCDIPFSTSSGDPTWTSRNEWKDITKLSGDDLIEAKKTLHNHGWYHGPLGVRYRTVQLHDDRLLNHNNSEPMGGKWYHIRRVIYTGNLNPDTYHTMRIKSVSDLNASQILDCIEIVPKSVYGLESTGKSENDY